MKLVFLFLCLSSVSHCQNVLFGGIIPVAYSPKLGVTESQFNSPYLKGVQIDTNDFKWPPNSSAGIYRASMGNFNEYFALNTTASNVAYFITGDLPQRSTNRSNWLRIAFQLGDFAPIVRKLTSETSQSSESVIIVDSSQECRYLRTACADSFTWSILTTANSTDLLNKLMGLKYDIYGKSVLFAICDGDIASSFSLLTITKLLETGLYFGSRVFVFSKTDMSKKENVEKFNAFKNAGADLTVVTPALSSAKEGPVELTVKVLEQLSKTAVTTTDSVFVDGEYVKFTGANFLRLIHKTEVIINLSNREKYKVCFTMDGFLCVIDADFTEIRGNSGVSSYVGVYDQRTGELVISSDISERPVVKLLAFQDVTFLPSLSQPKYSMASQMITEIFSDLPYNFQIYEVPFNKSLPIQLSIEEYLSGSNVSMAMSAFPLPIDTDTRVRHTETVLYDGIVMVKSRATSKVVLFRIFDSLSGFIWLCVFASLLVVAIIFFIIKIVNDWQTRELGTVPDDQDTSLFTRFLTVIFRNFSAVLLAKMILKPKQTSLRVLYQSYWMASILFVATYAASLAEQRFVVRNTVMPFNSLDGLLRNSMNYRWIFLQNSSVVWKIQQSRDAVLRDLWIKAEKEWPKEMIVMSVAEASDRISNDDHLILIASRLEATQILSEECNLEKSGPVEYLYGLGFLLSGDDAFANRLTQQISSLSDEHVFTAIESRALGIGDCPVSWEKINMQKKPFSLKELGGLFIIVLVGLIIAFIVAAIEFAIESFPMYRQWKRGTIRFGETYPGEVLNVQDDGIWIRLLDKESTAFVDVSHIKTTRGHDGRVHLELGSYVKATYLGNDPCTANPIFNVTEEKTFKPDVAEAVPPNNQPSGQ
uniref:S1 motif domain-containing protein n=1 Tax=Mesocestoides corti TaxID=53468 RepID=A0A5K3FGK8_MESCO